jgi:outer membrane protein OmpA-like peptidoglycan-associated protein
VALGGPTTDSLIQRGTSLAASIFGGRQGALANALASTSGINASSVTKLLALVVPLVLGLLKKHASDNRLDRLDAGGLSRLLAGQTDFLRGSLDSRLASALGLPGVDAVVSDARTRTAETARSLRDETVRAADTGPGLFRKLVPWLAAAAIEAPEGGFIDRFGAILADPNASIDKGLAFDAVNFETSSATLTAESREQLEQLGSVLGAYPAVRIRVEGYTDSSGDPAANLTLSQDRAAAVKAALVGEGIADGRIEATGFGQERPVASNATEEGRAQNRRVEVVVVKR